VSIGVATLVPQGDIERSELVAAADRALYSAKQAGRNRVIAA
jgi:PleD family two-component response regulator